MLRFTSKIDESARRLSLQFRMDGAGESKEVVAELDCQAALALARDIAVRLTLIDGEGVVTFQVGRSFITLEHVIAKQVARHILQSHLRLEELEQAERIAKDTAILYRSGAPLGLSNRPDIQEEAMKAAHWDSELRRAMPGGVKSHEAVGVPAVIKGPPRKKVLQ